jgi:hypothetical protein
LGTRLARRLDLFSAFVVGENVGFAPIRSEAFGNPMRAFVPTCSKVAAESAFLLVHRSANIAAWQG